MVSLKLSQAGLFGPPQLADAVGVMNVGPFHVTTGFDSETVPVLGVAPKVMGLKIRAMTQKNASNRGRGTALVENLLFEIPRTCNIEASCWLKPVKRPESLRQAIGLDRQSCGS